MEAIEKEYHFHQGPPVEHRSGAYAIPQPLHDETGRVHHYDNDKVWTVETYDRRIGEHLQSMGATEKPCSHDGRLFVVDARQLIEFIAESSGLIVEFRQRRRKQLSDEQREHLRQRMTSVRNAQSTKNGANYPVDNGAFSSSDLVPAIQ